MRLSLLDQAIAHAAGRCALNDVREMLGLADRTRAIDLFEALMAGHIGAALTNFADSTTLAPTPDLLPTSATSPTFVTRV